MRLLGASTLREQLVLPIKVNTDTINQDSEENHRMRLLGASILGEQPAPPIGANTKTIN